jgi:hypothetical protein
MLKKLFSLFKKKKTLSDYITQAEKDLGVIIDDTFAIRVNGLTYFYTKKDCAMEIKDGYHVRFFKYYFDEFGVVDCHFWENYDPLKS